MTDFFLPVLSHFQNGNPWSSSAGRMRYRILPDAEQGLLTVEIWEGPWAYEYSTVEATHAFPLTEDGLTQLPPWLEEWHTAISSRPPRSLEENAQRRDAVALIREGTRENPVKQE